MATVSEYLPWDEFNRRFGCQDDGKAESLGQDVERFDVFLDRVADVLNNPQSTLEESSIFLEQLFQRLLDHRQSTGTEEWRQFVRLCRQHPLKELVHEDPFTFRAYSKPRSYAGDAVMMDYIYGREELWPQPPASPIGRKVFQYTTSAPASEGVRARRGYVADLLDQLPAEKANAHVLAIASGHLREASMSSAVRRRKLGRFVAMDADSLSLREVERCYASYGVETWAGNIRRLLSNRNELGEFDLVYTTGLFDYLKQPLGRRLVTCMFQMLRPGGRLMVANFLPDVHDIGYMETFMDWFLIYRNRQDMIGLTDSLVESQIHDIRLIPVENRNIICLEVTRA